MAIKFLVALFLVGCAFGEDAPYAPSGTKPLGALLVLPTEVGSASANQPAAQYAAPQYLAPQPQPEVADNLKKASDNLMERLRQQQGADSGSYYVYLNDGRLQRVQYTTAPLSQGSAVQNNQEVDVQNSQTILNSNTFQFNQQNAEANSQAYIQDQSQRQQQLIQPYQGAASGQYNQQQASGQYRQQPSSLQYSAASAGYRYSQLQQTPNSQYRQQPSSEEAASNQYQQVSPAAQLKQPSNGQYSQQASSQYKQLSSSQYRAQPSSEEAASNQYSQQVPSAQQQSKPEKLTQGQQEQYRQQPSGVSDQYSKVAVQGSGTNENPAFAQQQQLYQLEQENQLQYQQQDALQWQQQQYVQQPLAAAYVASIQYTNVQPITTPIYSYSPAPLVRILRYAPMYQ